LAAALAVLALGLLLHRGSPSPDEAALAAEYRFAVYLPQASQARIIGSFTDWAPLPMRKVGNSGYWTLTIKIPPGEHRYSYEVDGENRLADPSVATREQDDFGGENSVIVIGGDDDPIS
jgi:1,4-alpha-glucan branching enzyme